MADFEWTQCAVCRAREGVHLGHKFLSRHCQLAPGVHTLGVQEHGVGLARNISLYPGQVLAQGIQSIPAGEASRAHSPTPGYRDQVISPAYSLEAVPRRRRRAWAVPPTFPAHSLNLLCLGQLLFHGTDGGLQLVDFIDETIL